MKEIKYPLPPFVSTLFCSVEFMHDIVKKKYIYIYKNACITIRSLKCCNRFVLPSTAALSASSIHQPNNKQLSYVRSASSVRPDNQNEHSESHTDQIYIFSFIWVKVSSFACNTSSSELMQTQQMLFLPQLLWVEHDSSIITSLRMCIHGHEYKFKAPWKKKKKNVSQQLHLIRIFILYTKASMNKYNWATWCKGTREEMTDRRNAVRRRREGDMMRIVSWILSLMIEEQQKKKEKSITQQLFTVDVPDPESGRFLLPYLVCLFNAYF